MHLLLYFNSIKVRLERIKELLENIGNFKFQFHKGTIRTFGKDEG